MSVSQQHSMQVVLIVRKYDEVESEGQNSVVLHIDFGEIPILSVINIIRWKGEEGKVM